MEKQQFTNSLTSLFTFMVMGLFALQLVACGDDDKDDKLIPPSAETVNSFTFNGDKHEIKSAAFFYNTEKKGYNIVFSDVETKLGEQEDVEPQGTVMTIDLPLHLINKITNLATETLHSYTWDMALTVKTAVVYDFSSGSLPVNISGGLFTIKLNATDTKGNTWKVSYEGYPTQSFHYIWSYM